MGFEGILQALKKVKA